MLKYRVITAAVLLVIFLGTLFYAPPPVFCRITMLFMLWAAWEWTLLMGVKKTAYRIGYLLFTLVVMESMYRGLSFALCEYMFYLTLAFWVLTLPLISFYPRALGWKKSYLCQGTMGLFVLAPAWFSLNFLRVVNVNGLVSVSGQSLLLYLFILVWTADTAAYFIGRAWGVKQIAPRVSPGKTTVGVFGGLGAALLVSAGFFYWLEFPLVLWPYVLTLAAVTVLFSVVGDLFESMFKRSEGLKDSGILLPGHGGLLDRIDSLTAAAPIFTLGAIIVSRLTS